MDSVDYEGGVREPPECGVSVIFCGACVPVVKERKSYISYFHFSGFPFASCAA